MKYLVNYTVKDHNGETSFAELNTKEELFTSLKSIRDELRFESSCVFKLDGSVDIKYEKKSLCQKKITEVTGTAVLVPDHYIIIDNDKL